MSLSEWVEVQTTYIEAVRDMVKAVIGIDVSDAERHSIFLRWQKACEAWNEINGEQATTNKAAP